VNWAGRWRVAALRVGSSRRRLGEASRGAADTTTTTTPHHMGGCCWSRNCPVSHGESVITGSVWATPDSPRHLCSFPPLGRAAHDKETWLWA